MIKVWDLPTRLYHWSQALVVMLLLFTGFGGRGSTLLHWAGGGLLLVLVLWRLGWGVIGSETSRFAHFLPGPSRLMRYMRGAEQLRVGHNPLGALMVVALLLFLAIQLISGLVICELFNGKAWWGRSGLTAAARVHEIGALVLLALISCHVMAVWIHGRRGHPLLRAMLTGWQVVDAPPPLLVSRGRALALLLMCLLVSAGMVLTLILIG